MHITRFLHYGYVIISAIPSQITSLTLVYSIVYSGADHRKHQSAASLAFARGIHRCGEFLAQRASDAESASIWWRHHENLIWRLWSVSLIKINIWFHSSVATLSEVLSHIFAVCILRWRFNRSWVKAKLIFGFSLFSMTSIYKLDPGCHVFPDYHR